ncbi:ABC transporter permease [Aeromicrobium sp. S22]|uniref:ABC transporter permease n=1 Tax=Aeromicrobium sp. S22 TaxID=2662029 RepID=UPI001E309464|nr:ABC transporter permease [Aeromicrobium sp. S22]
MSESTHASSSFSTGPVLSPVVLLIGVLLIQLGFTASYVGAFHSPKPDKAPIAVAPPAGAPEQLAQEMARTLNGLDDKPLKATVVKDEAEGRRKLKDRSVGAVLVLGEQGYQLLVASAEGSSLSEAIEKVVKTVAAEQQRPVKISDVVPAGKGDDLGLSAFYLAVGWVVGGYLAASILGITEGERLPSRRRLGIRIARVAVYSVLSGLGGAWIVGPWLDALDHGYWPLAAFGALLVFAVTVFTLACEAWVGVLGIGVAIVLFVVLGNPSAGGAFPTNLLPPFFSAIGPWLPPGAATSAIRGIVYFDNAGVRGPVLVMLAWLVVGLVLLIVPTLRQERARADA